MNPLLVIFNKTENNNKFLIKLTNHMTISLLQHEPKTCLGLMMHLY